MPAVSEKMGAKQMHKTIKDAPPGNDSPGSVFEPMREGTEVRAESRRTRPEERGREEQRS
jgi:hypothetical protein